MSSADWIFNKLPRGEDLPIDCKYNFSRGKQIADEADIPEDWTMEWIQCDDPQITEAGFEVAISYLTSDGMVFQPPTPDAKPVSYLYLRDQDEKLIATWDEGRWWTPDESKSFKMMNLVPATFFMAEQGRFSQLPRRYRRRLK